VESGKGIATNLGRAIKNGPKSWRKYAGIWRENPDFKAFLKEIEAVRLRAGQSRIT